MRNRHPVLLAAALAFTLASCQNETTSPAADPDSDIERFIPEAHRGQPFLTLAAGGGSFDAGVVVDFSFGAVGLHNGKAAGVLHFSTILGGLPVEFRGHVTCLAVDRENHRAWIGGVVTYNGSTHPSFTTPIHQVGKDIWFRVVDYGHPGGGVADRTTFVGFEGGGGILTSAEYCAARIWPGPPTDVQDARTGPLLTGNLAVR